MKKENKLTLWTTGGREEHLRQRKESLGFHLFLIFKAQSNFYIAQFDSPFQQTGVSRSELSIVGRDVGAIH